MDPLIARMLQDTRELRVTVSVMPLLPLLALAAVAAWYLRWSRGRVFLLDFACYRPPKSLLCSGEMYEWGTYGLAKHKGIDYPKELMDFQWRLLSASGVNPITALPPGMHKCPAETDLETARNEVKLTVFSAIREVFERTGLKPRDIDFLVLNCSMFSPTPSLTAMVVNQFKMRSDIISYNLSGMGCSAGIISIDLANRLLKASPNKYALVISTESMTQNMYLGKDRSMIVPNTLFRMGASAIVLTNKPAERRRAKYELQHVVRVHLGADDKAYECVFEKEDEEGLSGVALNRDIVGVAAKALEKNLTILAPKVLPWSELFKFAQDMILRKLKRRKGPAYKPDFRKAFQHFCLHAGGRAVVEGLGGQLGLTKVNLEPSFSSLYWFGNTSSSSYWYGFGYAEAKQGMRKGDKVWQVGFGSGFKTNSAVWRALRTFKEDRHKCWAPISEYDTQKMWRYLESKGCVFVDGVMPTHEQKKAMKAAAEARVETTGTKDAEADRMKDAVPAKGKH